MSNELAELPEGWVYSNLEELAVSDRNAIKRGPFGSAIKKEYFVPSGYKVYEQKNAIYNDFSLGNYYVDEDKFNELKDFAVSKGDILISCSGTVGKIAVVPEDAETGIINQALLKISLDKRKITTDYFIYLFGSDLFQEVFLGNTRGSAMQNIASVKTLKQTPLPLPPLNEQKRIVAKIEELRDRHQSAKQALEAVPKLCDRFRQSVLAAAFRGDLTADWREENPDVEPASVLLERIKQGKTERKQSKIEDRIPDPFILPSTWQWGKLIDVCISISDGDHQAPPKVEKGIPFLVISNIRNGELDFSETRYVPEEYYQAIQEVRKAAKGDILYSVVGSYGIPVLVDTEEPFCFQRHIALLKPSRLISAKYLLYALKSDLIFQQATEVATGTAQLTVPLSGLRQLKLAVPPLLEQYEIVRRIESFLKAMSQVVQQQQYAWTHLDQLNQSILTKAFRGDLVEQDPNDEPASVLLDRIRAEREQAGGKPKGKGKRGK